MVKDFPRGHRKKIARGTRVYTMTKLNSITSVDSSIKTVGL